MTTNSATEITSVRIGVSYRFFAQAISALTRGRHDRIDRGQRQPEVAFGEEQQPWIRDRLRAIERI
jgi:hypothetical protein